MRASLYCEPERYGPGLSLQRIAQEDTIADGVPRLLMMQHHPVYTIGTQVQEEDLAAIPLLDNGIEVCFVNRGGRGSYFALGMMLAYPIRIIQGARQIALHQMVQHLKSLEKSVTVLLGQYGIAAEPSGNVRHPGVWVVSNGERKKIAAVGVGFEKQSADRGYITQHGVVVYLNEKTNLNCFLLFF